MNRIIGKHDGGGNEVLLVLLGAVHGNELAGIHAIQNVLDSIEKEGLKINGKIVGIAGNLQAIEAKKRFQSYDLNRAWTTDQILSAERREVKLPEDTELLELHELIESLGRENYQKKILIDLHTTSADNGNFIVYPGEAKNDEVVQSLKLPVVINLENYIHGTLLHYARTLGFQSSFAFEGGQIGSEKSIELHTYGLWQILTSSGIMDETHDLARHIHYEELVGSLHSHNPKTVRVLHRHEVKQKDYFHMKPGFENFQRVERGELLAEDKKGLIHAPMNGYIFMPLYQNTGNDGFFIVEEV